MQEKGFMKALVKKVVPTVVIRTVRDIYGTRVTKKKVRRLVSDTKEIKLEIGAGIRGKAHSGWTTLDHDFGSDIYWDLTNGLPFPNESVSYIYSSHVLEHFDYRQLMALLNECFRVLKRGGEFSVCVPNARIYIEGYMNPDEFDRSFLNYEPAVYSNTRMDILNFVAFLNGEHRYMFDEENLVHVLKICGFLSAEIREFDPGLDMIERRSGSIYAKAIKI